MTHTKKQPRSPHPGQQHKARSMFSYLITFVLFVVGVIGFASAVVAFAPRLQVEASEKVDPLSPLPSFVTIINGFLPLDEVSVYVRIGVAISSEGAGKIIGSSHAGGITTPAWQNHHLQTDEKWQIPMGSNVPFVFNVGAADIFLVVTYWPWLLPRPSFVAVREHIVHLVIYHQQNGQQIWVAQPVN